MQISMEAGGAPLCSIARGHKEEGKAEEIIGNTFSLLVITGILLTVICLLVKKPVLYAFGASDITFPYADAYTKIYLLGSVFVMISLGMNGFINSQGFAEIWNGDSSGRGGAEYYFGSLCLSSSFTLGWRRLLIATAQLSQFRIGSLGAEIPHWKEDAFKAPDSKSPAAPHHGKGDCGARSVRLLYVLYKLCGSGGVQYHPPGSRRRCLCRSYDNYQFCAGDTDSACDGLYPGAQPVLGYNFGAGKYQRVKSGIKFMSVTCIVYTTVMWGITLLLPGGFIRLFNGSEAMFSLGIPAMQVYFFGFCFMSLQFSGQSVFTGLGKAKQAISFRFCERQ